MEAAAELAVLILFLLQTDLHLIKLNELMSVYKSDRQCSQIN